MMGTIILFINGIIVGGLRKACSLLRALFQKKAAYLGDQLGFTLVEALLAVFILGLIGTGFLTAINTSSRGSGNVDEQVVGSNLAIDYLEAINSAPYAPTYPDVGVNITVPFQYSVTIETECSSDGTNFSACTGGETETLQKIIINVSREGRGVYSICTYKSKR